MSERERDIKVWKNFYEINAQYNYNYNAIECDNHYLACLQIQVAEQLVKKLLEFTVRHKQNTQSQKSDEFNF